MTLTEFFLQAGVMIIAVAAAFAGFYPITILGISGIALLYVMGEYQGRSQSAAHRNAQAAIIQEFDSLDENWEQTRREIRRNVLTAARQQLEVENIYGVDSCEIRIDVDGDGVKVAKVLSIPELEEQVQHRICRNLATYVENEINNKPILKALLDHGCINIKTAALNSAVYT